MGKTTDALTPWAAISQNLLLAGTITFQFGTLKNAKFEKLSSMKTLEQSIFCLAEILVEENEYRMIGQ